jgi:hypothetical protein
MLYDDPIAERLRQSSPKYQTDDPWGDFRGDFIKKPPGDRAQDIWNVEAWINEYIKDHGSAPTRDLAGMFNAKRELSDLHQTMRRAGR